MCGIFGVIGDLDHRDRELAEELSNRNQERGQLAYGFLNDDQIIKGTGLFDPSVELLMTRRLFLGHTRAPTGGVSLDKKNNHPFQIGNLFLAHNGILINHRELARDLPFTDIETDSYTILSLIHYYHSHTFSLSESIIQACSRLKGSFACWLYDREVQTLFLFRVIAPLFFSPRLNSGRTRAVAFSSERFKLIEESCSLLEGVVVKYSLNDHLFEEVGRFPFYTPYLISHE